LSRSGMDAFAPNLDAFLSSRYKATIVLGADWRHARALASSSGPTLLSPEPLPLGRAQGLVCATVEVLSSDTYRVRVIREDPKDAPAGRYNVDDYVVYEGVLPSALKPFDKLVEQCSTSYNPNCQAYVAGRAFIERQPRSSDHWRADLPPEVKILIAPPSQ
jgi:hypothetical protein